MTDEKDTTEDENEKQTSLEELTKALTSDQENSADKLGIVGDTEHHYDTAMVMDFIDSVFGTAVPANAHRLVYTSPTNVPRAPMESVDKLKTVMTRTTKGRALYFATSSCYPRDDGKLSHSKSTFAAFHVLVLDDIGTKIDKHSLPEGMRDPSYIIETSQGNFQYGYVLETPLRSYEKAMVLVKTAAQAGLTDTSGAMPIKLVRLPEGINGKNDPIKQLFQVKLIHNTGPSYTPEQLMQRIDYSIDGKVNTLDSPDLDKRIYGNAGQLVKPALRAPDGLIDEVSEVLETMGSIVADTGDGWMDILCPQGHLHSDGNLTAGYMPLGRSEENPQRRSFKCFHDSCSDYDTEDFIRYILANSDLDCLAWYHTSPIMFHRYAYDTVQDGVHDLQTGIMHPYVPFTKKIAKSMWVYTKNGKAKHMTAVAYWMQSAYRIHIDAVTSNPEEPQIYIDETGAVCLNTFKSYPWQDGPVDMSRVGFFIDFIKYLLPAPSEYQYFIDWISAKMQNPLFRGTGILMTTSTQGIGRSTLGNIIEKLMGAHNCVDMTIDRLTTDKFNAWEDKLMLIVSEAMDGNGAHNMYAAYEVLKTRIDTTNRMVTMNKKYHNPIQVLAASSLLIFTNHGDALALDANDRRITVLSNPIQPRDAPYFNDLNAWMKDAKNIEAVYRWLREQTPDLDALQRPLHTVGKVAMSESTGSLLQKVCREVDTYMVDVDLIAITAGQLKRVVRRVVEEVDIEYPFSSQTGHYQKCAASITKLFKFQMRTGHAHPERLRVLLSAVRTGGVPNYNAEESQLDAGRLNPKLKKAIADSIAAIDEDDMFESIVDRLRE